MPSISDVEIVAEKPHNKLYLLNSPCIFLDPSENSATILLRRVDISEARELISYYESLGYEIVSAIGHEATAKLLTSLLGREVPVNRIEITVKPGDKLITFRLKKRLPEGKVIESIEELEEIGYEILFFDV